MGTGPDWRQATYVKASRLGKGSYGVVHKWIRVEDHLPKDVPRFLAIKEMDIDECDEVRILTRKTVE